MAWNGSNSGEAVSSPLHGGAGGSALKRKGFRFPVKGAVAGTVVVLGAACAWFLLVDSGRHESERPDKKTEPGLIKEVQPAAAPKQQTVADEGKPTAEKPQWKPGWGKDGYFHYRTTSGREMKTTNIYLIGSITSKTPGVQNPWAKRDESKPRRYNSVLQQELVGFLTPGQEVCLSRDYTDKEALEMARETINFGFDEPLETLEEKKAVQDVCKDLVKYIEEGGHAQDYLNELAHRQRLEHAAVTEARNEVRRICREEGDIEGAKAALEKFNKYLEGKGVRPLNMENSMEAWVRLGKRERGELK